MQDKVEMTTPGEPAPWVTGTIEAAPTTHLPDDVVATPFLLYLDSRTALANPRSGGIWMSLRYGERPNPDDLQDADREYIVGMLKAALAMLSSGDFNEDVGEQNPLE